MEGSGGATIVDASEASYSSIDAVGDGQPVCMLGLKLHVLTTGASFNLTTRQAVPGRLIKAKE